MADGFDPVIGALNTVLNLRQTNQNVISSNIANADTPGYKSQKLEFESALRDVMGVDRKVAVETSDARHIAHHDTDPVPVEIYDEPNGVESLDGNTVNRADQMAKMAENQIQYDAAVELMKKKLGMLKYSITEGGGNR